MSRKLSKRTIDQYVLDVIRENNPKTINELLPIVQLKYHLPKDEILEHVLRLQGQGKIFLKEDQPLIDPLFSRYILSGNVTWYWAITTIALATAVLVFTLPEDAYPFTYVRYVLGSIFVLFLPGYSLIKALFPLRDLDNIERTALSIGLSIALVPLAGLLLNYTPWGIRTTPVTLSLLILTTIFATAALLREHQARLTENQ